MIAAGSHHPPAGPVGPSGAASLWHGQYSTSAGSSKSAANPAARRTLPRKRKSARWGAGAAIAF